MVEEKLKIKNRGVKNFVFYEEHKTVRGILNYLARPNVGEFSSREEAEEFMKGFCKHELGFVGGIQRCALRINKNWELFKQSIELNI